MARFTFNLPDIGEGIAEAEIVAWHVKPGDMVEEDGRLADMMTDKATVEMESPVAGKVLEVAGEAGDVIAIGSPLVVLEVEGSVPDDVAAQNEAAGDQAEPAPAPAPPPPPEPEEEQSQSVQQVEPAPPPPAPPSSPAFTAPPQGSRPPGAPKVLASPAVRKRAKELGIDLCEVRPAQDGRVRHADLDAFLSYGASRGYAPAGGARPDETIKVVGLRRRIAENMAAAKRSIPHFTYVEECDVTELEKLRADLNAKRAHKDGDERPKLTMLPLLIAAICRVIPDFPMLNARYDDEANVVTRHGAVHMGMATMTDSGLMVPVIRNAQGMNLWQLAAEILRLSEAARTGKARSEELSGSTFTLTSLGPLGGIASTPVINKPEVAILAPNRIVERPVFVPDETGGERIAKRKLMNLSISCDHRVVDGYDAAAFVQAVKRLIETPALILAD
ncbi:2-oxoisovalerate dehydrogenase E2 component (dihydrolipoyl transacylase) [Altererythrobacter atlanticus]|uniref:Dihydrolipoamide acetyltransferase component of pyruvate dehydrogenase complex n=1 Tax=Croceibacterium atlanticum TaxID=1267766 RepID=A0A0F7KQJ0_9SPHN|nr:dihydrolipoamide acetyltransferase family protein [Croceibacterium atlanticum]AKH41412.1 Lipoamide acyltransferase component of branched-chain alpha-keto acid dehydrogenase complex [Croceibacterium atlanticum]MBB5732874.1 2-oxoisovalerate dehydrogenase E2 component (dihydrolipoyl transacylase) [Croceibacterium atlanticum]